MVEPPVRAINHELDDAGLRLHDLGPLVVSMQGADTRIRGDKPTRVLTTLLVHANHRVSIDTLTEAVWGEESLQTSSGALETHIWRLRKIIEPHRMRGAEPYYLINDNGGYRLLVNPDCADSLRFPQLAEQGDLFLVSGDPTRALERYELAVTLWRGRPFDAVADDEWAAAPIARLVELHAQVNEQRVTAMLRIGAVPTAVRELEALTVQLPYREHLWELLMLGLYQSGRVAEALTAYRRARDVLLDTVGLEPGQPLRDMQRRILDQDPTLAAAAPDQGRVATSPAVTVSEPTEVHLPTRISELVGRDIEMQRVTRLVERNRLVTLVGAAGCGKTRLAIEVARAAASVASDGVWFIDLAAVEDSSAVPDVVVSTMGVQRPPVGTALTALRSFTRDHAILLLVDNCEHVLPAVNRLLDAVLAEDSQCRVLATSREPTGFDGEILWTLSPLAVLENGEGGDEPSAAARLFLTRARSANPSFEPTPAIVAEVEAICTAVDGIPLAIELAAGRIRSASLGEVREQVTTGLSGLSRLGFVDTEHHRTVELSIDWSVRILAEVERATHARLSVLPGFFTAEAARAVAGVAPVRAPDVTQLLMQLAHRSMLDVVTAQEPNQATRFRQLATVRAHAAQALGAEADAARQRRTQWIESLVDAHPSFATGDTHGWNSRMADNHDTLAAVLQDLLVDRPEPAGVRLAARLGPYWVYHRRLGEGTRWLEAAIRQPDAAPIDRASAELALAYLLALRNRTDRAVPLVRSALVSVDRTRRRVLADRLGAVAWCAFLNGSHAMDFADAELRILASNDDPVIDLYCDLLTARAALRAQGPIAARESAGALFERAQRHHHVGVSWLAAWLCAQCALMTGDPAQGLHWLDHVRQASLLLSGIPAPGGPAVEDREPTQYRPGRMMPVAYDTELEFEANFATLAGEHERAAGLFALSSRLAFRGGFQWPLLPGSEQTLADVRTALQDDFEAAWRAGDPTTVS